MNLIPLTDGCINGSAKEHRIPKFPSFALFSTYSMGYFIIVHIQIVVAIFVQFGQAYHQIIHIFQCMLIPFR